jgi:hypothetical protein
MPDIEKVIKGLECCIIHVSCGADGGCPYKSQTDANCLDTAIKDALALLKAQEPVEPKKLMEKNKNGYRWRFYCGKCGDEIDRLDKYCRHCGRPVKWDG